MKKILFFITLTLLLFSCNSNLQPSNILTPPSWLQGEYEDNSGEFNISFSKTGFVITTRGGAVDYEEHLKLPNTKLEKQTILDNSYEVIINGAGIKTEFIFLREDNSIKFIMKNNGVSSTPIALKKK